LKRRGLILPAGAAAVLAATGAVLGWRWWRDRPHGALDDAALDRLLGTPLAAPEGPLATYHLGHSLVGRDMPAMLAQLSGHDHASQLGWGASLRQHWEPAEPVPGFDEENAHPAHRPAHVALGSGTYDAVVLTEMVEIRDAIRYHDSAFYLAKWARLVQAANPDARVYLYETWHRLDDAEGWLNRIDLDLNRYWRAILKGAMAQDGVGVIRLIPAGQAMAALVRRIDQSPIDGLSRREDLFARNPDGTQDTIHLNDLGAYFVALVHYATLYHKSPVGLSHRLRRADGSAADAPSEAAAALMQEVAWQVVRGYAATGVRAER
jgi:hypothetical protein